MSRTTPTTPKPLHATQPVVRSPRKRQLILAVEDERHDWEIYGKLLWYNGFDVLHATTAEEGLRLARTHRPDIILADLMLPGINGIELCRELRQAADTRDIPVVLLTAHAEQEFGARAREAGCERFLEKPMSPVDLLHVMEDLVGRPPPLAD